MPFLPEDLELDEGYWRALLEEVERLPILPTRPPAVPHPSSSPASNPAPAESASAPAKEAQTWATLKAHHGWLDVEIIGYNRGGLVAVYEDLRGFVPIAHLKANLSSLDDEARRASLASYVGQRLKVRVVELDPELNRVIFSEREPVEAHKPLPAGPSPIFAQIRAGETRRGYVTKLTSFGAFVDLGGYEGLVHVSELAWSRVNHPRDVLRVGQEVEVYVIQVLPEEGRIALSLKRAKPNPWETLEQRYHVGQLVEGVVTNVVQFGAFVKVESELEGLVHISELAEGNFLHPRSVVREGDHVVARVIGVDSQQRRLALSLRDVANRNAHLNGK
jgi:small subunit ribosomal protein S1